MPSQARSIESVLKKPSSVAGALIVLTIVAAAVRIPMLKLGLWRDECLTVFDIKPENIQTMLKVMQSVDDNPPLSYLILFPLAKAFGTGEITVRLPSYVEGLLLVPALFFLGASTRNRTIGFLAALFCALSPQAMFYSTQARSYSLAALCCCMATAFLCRAIKKDTSQDSQSSTDRGNVIGMSLFLVGFLYSNYLSALWVAGAGLATLCLKWKSRSFPLVKYLIAIGAAGVLFLPWMPVLLHQVVIPKVWEEKTPLTMFPVVVVSNLSCGVPLPFLPAMLVTILGAMWICLWILRKAIKGQAIKSMKELISALSPVDLTLIIILTIPACLLGYITSFYFGFYRYMYPFMPICWTLLAPLTLLVVAKFERGLSAKGPGWQKAPAILALSILLLADVQQAFSLGKTPRSGLRTLAAEVAAGKYKETIFLIVPDFDGITFAYYLNHWKVPAKDVAFHGFARWDADGPWHSKDYGALWRDPTLVDTTENRLKDMAISGKYRYLAFVRDPYNPDTPLMPSRQRINELFNRLNDRYVMVQKTKYAGITEPVDVYFFDLAMSPPKDPRGVKD